MRQAEGLGVVGGVVEKVERVEGVGIAGVVVKVGVWIEVRVREKVVVRVARRVWEVSVPEWMLAGGLLGVGLVFGMVVWEGERK